MGSDSFSYFTGIGPSVLQYCLDWLFLSFESSEIPLEFGRVVESTM